MYHPTCAQTWGQRGDEGAFSEDKLCTSCARRESPKTGRETLRKPLVPRGKRGLELPPRRARRAGRSEATPAEDEDRETGPRPPRFDHNARPRRERSASRQAGSSERTGQGCTTTGISSEGRARGCDPRERARATEVVDRWFVGRARRPPMSTTIHGTVPSGAGPPRGERATASAWAGATSTRHCTEAWTCGRGNLTADRVYVPRGPSISYIEGPRTCLAVGTPYRQDQDAPRGHELTHATRRDLPHAPGPWPAAIGSRGD